MELLHWVNESDNILGIVSRERAHREGLLHRIAVIYVLDGKGNILIQERCDGRLDHSSAGHVGQRETYEEAARRELSEELGIGQVTLKNVGVSFSDELNSKKGEHIRHLYKIFECVGAPGKLQRKEVKSVFWRPPLQVCADMQKNPDSVYAGGFRSTLACFLEKKKLLRKKAAVRRTAARRR